MRRFPGLLVAAVLLTTAADSQSPVNSQGSITSQNAANSSASRTETSPLPLQTSNQLLDVVVLDKAGLPVRGLKPNSFSLTDSNEQQTIARFQEHSSLGPVPQAQPLPKMPAGTFTDYTPVPPDGTLNILLLDALNTPTKDQNFIRNQLTQYVNQANPGTRIAIFGLANHLILLQGFTSDPATLKNIADHKLIPRSSSLLNRHADSDLVDPGSNDANAPAMSQLAANLQQFEAQTGTLETALRPNFTLDAFNTLARYLSAFPGRKNLIWFSGSFPLNLLPQPELNDPFASAPLDQQEYRETINLLRSARVAVYPVNALGVPNAPTSDAVGAGHAHQPKPEKPDADLKKIGASEATERSRMGGLASSTGGVPFDTANSLATAVASVVNAGSNYYTLSYNPAKFASTSPAIKQRTDCSSAIVPATTLPSHSRLNMTPQNPPRHPPSPLPRTEFPPISPPR
jgi:VWFA-related protein